LHKGVHNAVEFGILGPLKIVVDDSSVVVPAAKQRALLATLVLHAGRLLMLDKLTDAVWDERPPRDARGAIQAYIMRLRRVLGRPAGVPLIHTVPGGYLLDVDEDAVDAARFRRLTRQAERSAADGLLVAASREFGEALKLWRGQALEDVESASLHRGEALQLAEQRLIATERRIEIELALGHHRDVIDELTTLVAAHPLRERYWHLLMLALHQSGWRADALAAYQRARRLFIAELGIEPGDELRGLHDAILAGRPFTAARGPATARRPDAGAPAGPGRGPAGTPQPGRRPGDMAARRQPAGGARRGLAADAPALPATTDGWLRQCQLPRDTGDFTGRAAITEQMAADLCQPWQAVPVVAVCGPTGAGKTALAVRVAHRVRGQFPDGQLYLQLQQPGRQAAAGLGRVLADLMLATGRPRASIPSGLDQRAAAFRGWLADRRVLLVAENVTSTAQVRLLLPGTPGSAVILTSRHDLRALTVLSGARHYALGALGPAEAVELLERILGSRVRAEPAAAARLAELCGHLPLALRIAAASLASAPDLPLERYVARLGTDGGEPGRADGQSTPAQALFGDPYDHLSPALRRLLRLLSEQDFSTAEMAALLRAPASRPRRRIPRAGQGRSAGPPPAGPPQPGPPGSASPGRDTPDHDASTDRGRPVMTRRAAASAREAGPGDAPAAPLTCPMTSLQAGMVYHSELGDSPGAYHSLLTLTVPGELEAAALAGALAEATARHGALRTGFLLAGPDGPRQVIHARCRVPLTEHDYSALDPRTAHDRLGTWQRTEQGAGFGWAEPPLLRAFAHRLPGQAFALTLSYHHAILDGRSAVALGMEIVRRYAARRGGEDGAGAPATGPAADDAAATARAYSAVADAERAATATPEAAAFWRSALAGPVTSLPRQPRFPEAGTTGCNSLRWEIPAEVAAGLARAAERLGTPFRAVLLAAYLRALGVASGEEEVVTGVVAAAAAAPDEPGEPLGMFLTTVPVRASLRQPSWAALIAAVSAAERAALRHRASPLAEIQRATGATPPFTVLFDHRPDAYLATADAGPAAWELIEETSVPVVASFRGRPDGAGLTLALTYHRREFPAAQVRRLGGYCRTALAGIAADTAADPRPSGPYLAGDAALIARWNDTHHDYPPVTLPDLVAGQAQATPGAPAVWADGSWLSYREFAAGVHRLARHLAERGVSAGDVVGVCLQRGADLVTAVHAVAAAGAAYLPLEPDYPRQRLALMAGDAGARVVVTTSAHAGRLAGDPARQDAPPALVLLDAEAAAIGARPARPLGRAIPRDALAFVMYTSGSTGTPKGVGVSHGGLANQLQWMQRTFSLGAGDRVVQKTPFSFDTSTWELFWPLLHGAGLVVAEPGGHLDPGYLVRLAAGHRVTTVHWVPSMLEGLLGEPDLAARLAALRRVICAGEALSPPLAERFHRALPHVELHNLYGPTETAVAVTWHRCQPGDDPLPIGRPIANTQIRITDPLGGQSPLGVPGELCIAGCQLARGYLGRPELTAQQFPADPFGPPGGRMYRTGDRARWLASGQVEYLGRMDHQVQLQGLRIELGEIEAALASCPGVRTGAVAVAGGAAGQYLVAYPVPDDPAHPVEGNRIRRHLAALLPPYMIPARYLTLAALPVNANGKLDRKALPAPDQLAPDGDRAPADEAEEALEDLWQELLGPAAADTGRGFFELGGTSLLAMRLAERIAAEFGQRVPLAVITGSATITQLAAWLREHGADRPVTPRGGPAGGGQARGGHARGGPR
jgi:amino acid adenylation domain-containing protein